MNARRADATTFNSNYNQYIGLNVADITPYNLTRLELIIMQDDENYDKRNEKQKKKKAMTEEETMVLQALNNWLFNMLRLVWLGTNFPFSERRSNVSCNLLVSNGDDRVFTSECFRCTQKTAGGFDLFEQFTAQHYGVVRGKNEKRFLTNEDYKVLKALRQLIRPPCQSIDCYMPPTNNVSGLMSLENVPLL